MYTVINNEKIEIIEYRGVFHRFQGLMLKMKKIDKIYLFRNCHSIHTFFMLQNIDVCMTDKNEKIVFLRENVKPNRIINNKKASHTYEMPLNSCKFLKLNDYFH